MSGHSPAGPLRVLHVDTGAHWRGGQRQVFLLHRGLSARGVDSALACTAGGELERRTREAGLPVVGLPLRGEWDLLSAWHLAALARTRGAVLLHAHSSHAQTLALLAARLAGLPRVIATRRVDFVLSRHRLNRWKYGRAVSRLVAISAAIRDVLVRFGVEAERLRLVPSGVETPAPDPTAGRRFRRELGIEEGERVVGNIAHLADHKGQRYLLAAAPAVLARFPEARFLIVGDGELAADLKAQAAALELGDRVLFPGFREDVAAALAACDVFVMASHLEGLGTVVLDALAAAKPVVATAAGGLPEIIEDGVHGLLVPPRDPAAIAHAVGRLLADPCLGGTLGAAGRVRVRDRFSAEAMVEGNLAVYREFVP